MTKAAQKETTKNTKVATKKNSVKEVKPAAVKTEAPKKEKKSRVTVKQYTNSEFQKLFIENGCGTFSKAKDSSDVVYNTFGTKSRVLQQGSAYQLLLTNGHKKVKDQIVECDNNDVARFDKFYAKLSKADQEQVIGYDTIQTTKLSLSELPRERSVKIKNEDLLVKFLKFMATFEENKVPAPAEK